MKNYLLIFGGFCTVATLAAVMLRPDTRVRFEAEVMHLEPEEALVRLDQSKDAFPYHDTLRLTHARLALGAGDLDGARRLFSELLKVEKPSPEILDYLSEVALLQNDLVDAAALARQAQDIRPSEERRRRLSYWYRVLKDSDEELAVLSAAAPKVMTEWEVERLGQLYLNAGDAAAYVSLLDALAASDRADAVEFQRRLIEVHTATGEFEAAAQTAFEGFKAADREIETVQFTLIRLIEKGAIDPAQDLAVRVLRDTPGVGHTLVMPFIRAGHGGIARSLQNAWLASASMLTTDQWIALSDFAEITGDLSGLREALTRASSGTSDLVPGSVFMQFVRYGGARSLIPFRGYLTPELLEEHPLVAAAWSGWTNDPTTTYTHLVRASRSPLSDWDRSIWMSIAEGLKGSGYFSQLLAGEPSDPQLRAMLRATVLREETASPDG